jgi:tetratricopeptide (TPR) repeat protein
MISAENGFALPVKWNLHRNSQYAFAGIALFIFLLIIYSNSFYGDWHFDDYFNIVSNPYIQINDFSWDNIKKCIYGLAQERPSRPLSYLSFAVNYYFDGTNVFGYHVVNFAIHYLAAIFLFLFIYNTLQLPLLRDKFHSIAYPAALLAALFWAISPVWVTSVTYIVQRMASLAGLFYIMSLYFYLKGRTSAKFISSVFFFIFCAVTGLAAVLSKENAAMLPVAIFLYDLLLIRGAGQDSIKKYLKIFFLPAAIMLIAAFIYVDFSAVFDGYKMRDFTPLQRVLTEPRVILFYLSLLFFPVNSRLTLLYDIEVSRSLLHPWTTLPAILLVLAALGFAFYLAKRRPLFSFCIIFYFLNHLIEGSFFNLELIFEHRNYIPAMLLFLPAAIFFISLLNYFSAKKFLQWAVFAAVIIILVGLGNGTYRRNYIVSDDFRLWFDNNEKYPQLSRTHSNLGNAYLAQNQREKALSEYEKAMSLNNFGGIYARAVQEHNLGLYKYAEGKYAEALPYFVSSSKILPSYLSNTIFIARIHLLKNEFSSAYNIVQPALEKYPRNSDLGELFCLILLRTNNFSQAENYAKSFLQNNSAAFPLAVMAQTARQKGNLPAAINLWKRYQNLLPDDRLANLALVELYAAGNDRIMLKKELAKLYCLQGDKPLAAYINEKSGQRNLFVYRPDYNLIKRIVNNNLL